MTAVIQVRSSRKDSEWYQELLKADWTRETLDNVLSLLWDLIARSAKPTTYAWQKLLASRSEVKAGEPDKEVLARIRELSLPFTEPPLPAIPTELTSRKTRATALAEKAWTNLIIQALAKLTGDVGLFMDTQSLLFLCCIYYLLPHLKHLRLLPEHDCLVNVMYVHTLVVWRAQPAHLYYLQSLLMDYLDDPLKGLDLLEHSLRLTPVEDHSYLTKATAYWADLMNLGRNKKALDFLLSLNRHSPGEYQSEIGEMIAETLAGSK